MTDKEIIEYLRNNKYQKATNGLYNVLPSVKKYISANSGTADDAKDIFQDALVILYKNVQSESFTLSVPLKTYLLAVTKNLWLQELRRRNKMLVSTEQIEIPDTVSGEEQHLALATAAFNLAVFYERTNAIAQAEAQWKQYLELDSKSDWAVEARERLEGLSR